MIRCIHFYSNKDFPNTLINFARYRQLGQLGIHDIRDFTKKDLAENAAFIKKTWYPKIIKIITKHYRKQNEYRLTRKQWQKAWDAATGLIARQINCLKMRTIEHLTAVILNRHEIPFLKIIAICDERIDLCPTIEEIYEMYHNFIDLINEIGNNLDSIEFLIADKAKFENVRMSIKVELNETVLRDIHDSLQHVLEISYSPIESYLSSFQMEFYGLSSDQARHELTEYLTVERTYEEYFEEVVKYKLYIDKLKLLVQKEFFNEAIVSQSDAVCGLRNISERLIKRIVDKIISKHKADIRGISNEYEEIKGRALEVPTSTEALFKTGEYLMHVKKTVMDELGERIRECLRLTGQIIELTEMDREHKQLLTDVVDW